MMRDLLVYGHNAELCQEAFNEQLTGIFWEQWQRYWASQENKRESRRHSA